MLRKRTTLKRPGCNTRTNHSARYAQRSDAHLDRIVSNPNGLGDFVGVAEVIIGVVWLLFCARSRARSNFLIRAWWYACLNEGVVFLLGHAVVIKGVGSFFAS